MPSINLGMSCLTSEYKDFKEIVIAIKNMINDKKANIIFGVNDDIRIELDYNSLSEYSIKKDVLDNIANKEFIPILLSLLQKQVDTFAKLQVREYKNELDDDSDNTANAVEDFKNIINEKILLVKELFLDENMKRRYIIKSTTKHSIISSIKWEINKKLFNDGNESTLNSTYATLKIITDKNSDEYNPLSKIFPFTQFSSNENQLLLDFDINDLEFLIKTLNDVKIKLNNIE